MNNEEKARAIIGEDCKKENCLQCGGRYSAEKGGCAEYQKIMQMAQWKDEQAKQLHKIIIKLWDMLDWIDTYADLKINGSENDVYFSKIENKTKERFDFVKSDGYDLFINDEKITNNEHNTTKTD